MKKFNSDKRRFLLDNDCDDLCLNAHQVEYWKKNSRTDVNYIGCW